MLGIDATTVYKNHNTGKLLKSTRIWGKMTDFLMQIRLPPPVAEMNQEVYNWGHRSDFPIPIVNGISGHKFLDASSHLTVRPPCLSSSIQYVPSYH